ncbi:MAG: glucosaminidase domain-containing protein [Bacteroides sp.]|nr:glucosaminidase domain-containing protein [Bacteroides sp.]
MKTKPNFNLAERNGYPGKIRIHFFQVKRTYLCILIFVFYLPTVSAYNDISIIGPTTTTLEQLKAWARKSGATETFIKLADIYWVYSISTGINPVVAYCQAAKETGYGHFGGIVQEKCRNLCGLKKRCPK